MGCLELFFSFSPHPCDFIEGDLDGLQDVRRRLPGTCQIARGCLPNAVERDDIASLGKELFSFYNLPFQIIGVLLFVATIGVVVLSKRELK